VTNLAWDTTYLSRALFNLHKGEFRGKLDPIMPGLDALAGEVFSAMYAGSLRCQDVPTAAGRVSSALANAAEADPIWGKLRRQCRGNLTASVAATTAWTVAMAAMELPEAPDDATDEELDDHAQDVAWEVGEILNSEGGLRRVGAMARVEAAVESAQAIARILGDKSSQPDEVAALQAAVQLDRFREVAKYLGAARSIANAATSRATSNTGEAPAQIALGSSLDRMTPEERLNYAHPATRLDTLRRYSEAQLLVEKLRCDEPMGGGDFVLCLDCSGSMLGAEWERAKTAALSLAMIAEDEGRRWKVVNFDDYVHDAATSLIEVAALRCHGGGTAIHAALREAAKGLPARTDVVVLTDGHCQNEEATASMVRRLRDADARVHLVTTSGYSGYSAWNVVTHLTSMGDAITDALAPVVLQ
jgi:uncharacterized protein with von Willebrand factor type A (vWA) domain